MVKVFSNNHWKSFILEHFRAVKLKIFFNHGESIPQQSLEILHCGAFQSSKTQNGGGGGVLFDKVFLISEEYASTNVPGNIDLSV